jgi:hypothetical protein
MIQRQLGQSKESVLIATPHGGAMEFDQRLLRGVLKPLGTKIATERVFAGKA